MTQPLVDAETAARVGQAPRFVSPVALAQGSAQAALSIGPIGWALGIAVLVTSDRYDQQGVLVGLAAQIAVALLTTLLAVLIARRGAVGEAEPLPAGVVLVPAADTRRMMLRTSLAGVLFAFALLVVLTAGSNPSLLGCWSAATIGFGFGQRTRAAVFRAREEALDKTLYVPERRQPDVPRLVAGPREPETHREG